MTTRRDKTPILHRLNSQQTDHPYSKSPNIYTKEMEKQKTIKESTSRGSLGRSKYKKVLQKKSSNNNSDQNDRIALLMKQNSDLRKEIVELKVHQFYQFDDKKLKQLLIELQSLKKQLKKCKQLLQHSEQQNDFLRRTNSQLKAQIQKVQETKLYEKKYREKTIKNMALSPRGIRQDQEMTQRIGQKPVISQSNAYDDFEDCRKLLESKSTTKKDKVRRVKQAENEYLLLLQSKQRIIEPLSPRNEPKQRLQTSPRKSNDLLHYKSRRNNYLDKDQV